MKPGYMRQIFTQNVMWSEVISADSSLTEETTKSHYLAYVRMSSESNARAADSSGEHLNSGASTKLYILRNYSTCDDSFTLPAIKNGDTITTVAGRDLVVEEVKTLYGVGGEVHHMEITLK